MDYYIHLAIGQIKSVCIRKRKLLQSAQIALKHCESLDGMSLPQFHEYLQHISYEIRRKRGDRRVHIGTIAQISKRVLGITPHLEQIMGIDCIVDGHIIEMQTGEGKTLTAALSAIYKGWQYGNCHIVTSNDYLAQRDALKMEELFSFCNLSVGYVISTIEPQTRKQYYDCDIVYTTSKELLADYLRDRVDGIFDKYSTQNLLETYNNTTKSQVMRGLQSAIIDEADSVLADEATVPLIIASGEENQDLEKALVVIAGLSRYLIENVDYSVDTIHKEISITDKGYEKFVLHKSKIPDVWSSEIRSKYLLQQTLNAKHFYFKNIQYSIDSDGKIVIIDEKTGRLMHGRSWGGALHQAIEVKENLNITQMTQTHKKMSFQFFFKLYKDLSGMSGTLQGLKTEMWSIYELLLVKIPTHKPKQMRLYKELLCDTKEAKWDKVVQSAICEANKGRAVLVGTRSIEESEFLFEKIAKQYKNTVLLNALYQDIEADIIAQAGRKGQITISTNMAGRGVDIFVDLDVLNVGGLHVIGTERHESRRVDLQLYGRTARQGQIGSVQSIVSLDDNLLANNMPKILIFIMKIIYKWKIGNKISRSIYVFLQFYIDRKISSSRKGRLINDIQLFKMLSFSGD